LFSERSTQCSNIILTHGDQEKRFKRTRLQRSQTLFENIRKEVALNKAIIRHEDYFPSLVF